MYDFAYQKPSSLADAVKVLGADPEAKALAGGMTLIPVLKQRLNKPTVVVDLAKLGLAGITVAGNTVTIGGMTTHGAVATNADVKGKFATLAQLASIIGDDAVRHRGTIGGSLANNDPAADYPAAALALGATIKTDRRSIKADDFFQGMFTTALEQGELITSVEFPAPEKGAYEKFRNPASRYAIVGVYVAKTAGGVRVAVTGAGQNGVYRHTAMEQALSANFSPDAIAGITTPPDGMNSDIHASAEYRAHLVGVMAKRAVARAY
jgi:carbon-monoxide dehydrogenase medium subunit